MSRDDVFPRSLGRSRVHAFTWSQTRPSLSRRARRLAAGTPASKLCSPRESVRLRPQALARAKSPRRCSPGHFPSRACSMTIPGSVSHVDGRRQGSCPDSVCLREPSHLASIARPEFRRPGSRTQDLPARCGRSNPLPPSGSNPAWRSVRDGSPRQPPASLPVREVKRLACAPSRRRPAPPAPFTNGTRRGCLSLDHGDAGCEIVLVDQPLARPAISWGSVPSRVGS